MTQTNSTPRPTPTTEAEFQKLMEIVDSTLRTQDTPLYVLEQAALQEVSRLLRVEQSPMEARLHEPRPGSYSGLDLTARVIRWLQERYGDRLRSFDPRPGRVALILRSQVWVFHLPLIIGQHDVVASRDVESTRDPSLGGTPTPVYNIVDALEGVTTSLKRSLTNRELLQLMAVFRTGMPAYLLGRSLRDQPFVPEAITDHEATVNFLAGNDTHAGQARWATLQAAEKMLKSCISLSGSRPERNHDVRGLATAATAHGLVLSPSLLDHIQVGAGVRYGEIPTSVEEAVLAHHAALEITRVVAVHMRERLGRHGLDWSSARPSH